MATSTLELGRTLRPGKESLEDTALVTVATMGASCSSTAQSTNWPSSTQSSKKDLLSKKRAAHQTHLSQPTCHPKKVTFRCTYSILQCKLREIQNDWWAYLAMKTDLCFRANSGVMDMMFVLCQLQEKCRVQNEIQNDWWAYLAMKTDLCFRANSGAMDMMFVLCQLQEKCRVQNEELYATFVDLTKAFDMVSRTGRWLILERLGCPPKFLQMVIQLHENQCGQIRLNGDLSCPAPSPRV